MQEFIAYLAAPSLNSPRSSDEYAHSGNFDWPADEVCELMVEQALGPVAAVAVEREAALQWQLQNSARARDIATTDRKSVV